MWRWICLTTLFIVCTFEVDARKSCEIPFDLKSELIIVSAEVDGQIGAFILDTAAPTLVLNAQYFTGEYHGTQLQGLHQEMQVRERNVRAFQWACLQKRSLNAIILDLSHFEENLDVPLFGLIGYEVLKQWQIQFDYAAQRLHLQRGKQHGISNQQRTLASIPFELVEHLVTFDLAIGGQSYRLVLDSASGANMLQKDIHNEELEYIDSPVLVRSADKTQGIYPQSIALESSISDAAFFNQPFVRLDLEAITPRLDGLLGFPFLSCCKISIDYKKGQITIWSDGMEDTLANR